VLKAHVPAPASTVDFGEGDASKNPLVSLLLRREEGKAPNDGIWGIGTGRYA